MPKKILLADDSITIQKVVELTFSDGDYEVTAVNNGAKAVQKLAEMRPDIILSDIIMPEKNGYEVCEYVKSHPDFRNIPVVLLTGTFEPFDPDRAEKAGCDAVVTKPFESQSLIHKVEELIASAQSAASAASAVAEPEPSASPWMEEAPEETPEEIGQAPASSFSTAGNDAFTHEPDIFGAAPAPAATTEMPFEMPSTEFSGETRAFPRMSFEELSGAAAPAEPPAAAPAPEPSPWDEPAEQFSGETRAFGKMSFEDFAASAPAPVAESPFDTPPISAASPEPEPEPAPWSTPVPEPAEPASASPFGQEAQSPYGGETRAFPKLSFDDLQQMASSTPPPAAETEPSPWGEPAAFADEAPAFGSSTPAFTDDTPAFGQDAPAFGQDASAFSDDAPAYGGETRAFPKLSFDDFQPPVSEPEAAAPPSTVPDFSAPEPEAAPWDDPAAAPSPFGAPVDEEPSEVEPVESLWAPAAGPSVLDTPAAESFSTTADTPFAESPSPFAEPLPEDLPFASETTPQPEPAAASEPSWAPAAAAEAAAETEDQPVPPAALTPDAPPMSIARGSSDLTDDQIDRIARRVVELMSEQVVRNIAWEVIPDLAEMVVKERIRQLEAEA
jgi:CheY-like chemotaxis protein